MSVYSWGVDGYGNKFICYQGGKKVLFCVPSQLSVMRAIEVMEQIILQNRKHWYFVRIKNPAPKKDEVEFFNDWVLWDGAEWIMDEYLGFEVVAVIKDSEATIKDT